METNYTNGEIVQHLVSKRCAIVADNAYGSIGGYVLTDSEASTRWVPTDEYVTWDYREIVRVAPANNEMAIDMGLLT